MTKHAVRQRKVESRKNLKPFRKSIQNFRPDRQNCCKKQILLKPNQPEGRSCLTGFTPLRWHTPKGGLLLDCHSERTGAKDPMMTLDFVIPGFSKCGTTTLCELLSQHPQIAIPQKEPGYFAQHFGLGVGWYAELFRTVPPGVLRGDASTTYSSAEYVDVASIRLGSRFPGLKCIFIARHPLTRLESSFRQMHHTGHLFGVSAERDLETTLAKLPNMIADTRYWQLLNRYRRFFPDENLLVLFLEDLARQPEVEVRRCFKFLGLDPQVPLTGLNRRSNPGQAKEYDTAAMRFIRRHRWLRLFWNRLDRDRRNQLARRLGLRRRFARPVACSAAAMEKIRRDVAGDSEQLLAYAGKPSDFWAWPEAA